ncbi:MFS transporter [Lonepinella sp. BR2474]|uniref:MFS transporter n=1 Tax=Lonepinella sp. BR2474 TaxID=3434548 RepID=UPI003F6DED06
MSTVTKLPWYKEVNPMQKKALFAAWLGYVFDGFDYMLITYVLLDIQKEFSMTTTETSTLLLAAFIARPLGGAIFGSFADKHGRRLAMIVSIIVYSVGTFLCGLSTNFIWLFIFRMIVGMGMAGEYACSSSYAVESWPQHLRTKASAFLVSGFSVGNILASQIIPTVSANYGWRVAFFIGLIPVILVLYVRRHAPESEEWEKARDAGKTNKVSLWALFSKQQLATTLIIFAVCYSIFSVNWPITGLLPLYLKENGYAESVKSLMFWAGFGILIGTLISGFVGDKWGEKKTFIVGLLLSLIFLFPAFYLPEGNTALLGALLFCLMATNLGIAGLVPKYMSKFFPTEMRSAGIGFIYNVAAIGGGVSPVIAAKVSEQVGLGKSLVYVTLFWTVTLVLLVGLRIPERIQQRNQCIQK